MRYNTMQLNTIQLNTITLQVMKKILYIVSRSSYVHTYPNSLFCNHVLCSKTSIVNKDTKTGI